VYVGGGLWSLGDASTARFVCLVGFSLGILLCAVVEETVRGIPTAVPLAAWRAMGMGDGRCVCFLLPLPPDPTN
jgi:hypothetical protein